jgi:putative transposase
VKSHYTLIGTCSPNHKAFILKPGKDGVAVAEICREAGIHPAAYFSRKDGLPPTARRRLMPLEDENAKPDKLVTDPSLDKEMLQDVIRRELGARSCSPA